MRFTYIKLKNYIGIYQGCNGLKELYIDFTKCKNRITMIKAKNGGGKSTLLKALNIFPDSNDMFIDGEEAYKEIGILDNNILYIIRCDHPVNKDGSRGQARAYIKKSTIDGFIELNSTGTIRSFKDIIDVEFGLDPNFMALSSLSTEDKGLVEKTPTERKKYVNAIISNVEVFNNILKALTKRNSINKSMMNNLISKIDNIGEEEALLSTLDSINNRIIQLEMSKEQVVKGIADADSMIKILDPNLEIQNMDKSIRAELDILKTEMNKELEKLQYIYSDNSNSFSKENCSSLDQCNTLYYEYKNKIDTLKNKNIELQKNISDMLVSREEESKALVLKTQRLESLQSEYNYRDLEISIKKYESDIKQYEEFFDKAGIRNAINITKDEYILGLNTLKDIKDMIDNFQSYSYNNTIEKSVQYILSNKNPMTDLDNMKKIYEDNKKRYDNLSKEYSYNEGLLEKVKLLSNRHKDCKIDDCVFVKDLLEAEKAKPEERLKEIENEIISVTNNINSLEVEMKYIEECISAVRDIQIILRSINNNKSIISKLPNGNIFIDTKEFLTRLSNGNQFNEINDLYQYINYANIFEEYKIATDTLYKLNVDYKIYESKNDMIEEISKDVDNIQSRLENIVSDIDTMNNIISSNDKIISDSEEYFNTLNVLKDIFTKIKDIKNKKNDAESRLNTITTNMQKINKYLNDKVQYNSNLTLINNELDPLLKNRDTIKYNLKMLQDYKTELKDITDSYNMIEVLKKYTTPSKKGIQNIFIKTYMNQSLKLANQILSMFFNGRLMLTTFNIGEEGFSIPAISMDTGMEVDDIKSCSRSEKAMASLALSAAMFKQSSTHYNIFRLDEIDEGLDSNNRIMYIKVLNDILDILEIEQCIIVSHSSELSLANVDIIRLVVDNDSVVGNEGNIIFQL